MLSTDTSPPPTDTAGTTPTRTLDHVRTDLRAICDAMDAAFPERVRVIRATAACAVAGEHLCLIGPPGTGKSALIRAFAGQVSGGSFFEYLLTRFSEPNEVFGAVDLAAYKAGSYRRNTAGMLPEAGFAFLDEAFKANSAILNSLLTILNERRFNNGGSQAPVPLRFCALASNELPEGDQLAALWDRALIRFVVEPLTDEANRRALIRGGLGRVPAGTPRVTMTDLEAAGRAAEALPLTTAAEDALIALERKLKEKGIVASDRRWAVIPKYLRAMAWLGGNTEVGEVDLAPISDALWSQPEHVGTVTEVVDSVVATWIRDVRRLNALADDLAAKLKGAPSGSTASAALQALGPILAQATEAVADAEALGMRLKGRPEVDHCITRLRDTAVEIKNAIRRAV